MKIFLNADTYKQSTRQTKEKLIKYSNNLDLKIVDEISKADIVFSIGGNGTFLKTSKLTDKPIIGINTGTLGYLTEVNPNDLKKALKDIINEKYHIEKRMMIEGKIIKSEDVIDIQKSLNEIAISKNTFGVIRLNKKR